MVDENRLAAQHAPHLICSDSSMVDENQGHQSRINHSVRGSDSSMVDENKKDEALKTLYVKFRFLYGR